MKALAGKSPVFELREWESTSTLSGLRLTAADRQLAEALSAGQRMVVEELLEGVRIRATSWIGVVQFEHFEVRVVPKLVGGNLGVLEMLEYASGVEALTRLQSIRLLDVSTQGRLVDLLAMLLAEASERIVRDGLLQDYVTREESLNVLRGRLRVVDQFRRRFGRIDHLECLFDELESDTLENRLLTVGLSLARAASRHPEVRRRVTRMHAVLAEACDPSAFEPETAEAELSYSRRNEHYRTAHTLAWFFIRRLAVRDVFAPGVGRSFAFLLDMNLLFEQFVTRLLEESFQGTDVRVVAQARDRSLVIDERTDRPYATVIPDVLLERPDVSGRRRVPIDAKYKLYDEHRLDPSDVYQTFFYGYAYARDVDHAAGRAEAFIVYPASGTGEAVRLRVRRRDGITSARIRALALDVPAVLAAVREQRMKDLSDLEPIRSAALAGPG
jgi:5-methylcytosine-specific restriction enzyme subunit McrC